PRIGVVAAADIGAHHDADLLAAVEVGDIGTRRREARGQQQDGNEGDGNEALHHAARRTVIRRPTPGSVPERPSGPRKRSRHAHITAWLLLTTGLPSRRSISATASIWVVLVQARK